MVALVDPAASWVVELEGPEEVGSLLEVGTNGVDLVDEVLNADDAVLAEGSLDDGVVGETDAVAANLAVAALVDELANGLESGGSVCDEGLDEAEHGHGGLVDAEEDAVVDLAEAEELENLAGLGGDSVDTADAGDEENLGLRGDEDRALSSGSLGLLDLSGSSGAVLLGVGLSALEDLGLLGGAGDGSNGLLVSSELAGLLLDLGGLEDGLGNLGDSGGPSKKAR